MTRRLFGTDGIRGRAFEPPLDEATVRRLGGALAGALGGRHSRPEILLAGDTRRSTERLAGWIAESFQAHGGSVTWGGVLPTPAVSQLLRAGDWAAGIVISASHNPAHDNGIKILGARGEKVSDAIESELEEALAVIEPATGPDLPTTDVVLRERYRDYLVASHRHERPLAGLEVVVDAANGAASGLAESFLQLIGADTISIASTPDGDNINDGVGATAPQSLADAVRRQGAFAGLALDGDADRVMLCTSSGRVLNGDDILLAWARNLDGAGRLDRRTVVATVMSNLGLERALERDGISMVRCPVGDRAVWETMKRSGAALGGEQSGHIICSHYGVTGDGLLTGSHLIAAAARTGRTLDEISDLETMPQVLVNCPVRNRTPLDSVPEIVAAVERSEGLLGGRGRLLLRYSGTEPLVRIMVEGEEEAEIAGIADDLAEIMRRHL